jgi:hypothetical protein
MFGIGIFGGGRYISPDVHPSKFPKTESATTAEECEGIEVDEAANEKRRAELTQAFDEACAEVQSKRTDKTWTLQNSVDFVWGPLWIKEPDFKEWFHACEKYESEYYLPIKQLWNYECDMQTKLQTVVIKQLCTMPPFCDKEDDFKKIFKQLHIMHPKNTSVPMYAYELFNRFKTTFKKAGVSEYEAMSSWFQTIKISQHAIYKRRDVPCLMFRMCVYLALVHLEDNMRKPKVYARFVWNTATYVEEDKPALFSLVLATLDQFKWDTHVRFDSYAASYAASVKALPGLPEEDKQTMLEMLADDDKLHLAEFGVFLKLCFYGSCYQDEHGEWQYVDKFISIVSSPALHQKVHFVAPDPDYDTDDDFYGTITGYTAPDLFDIEGQNSAGEERKLMKVKLPQLHLYLVVRPPSAALRADPRVFQRVGSSKY